MADDPTVLVPVAVLEGETVPEGVVEFLSPLSVVVLGYHVLPEQTPPDQARLQFEERAQAKLDDVADAFREAGAAAETRLVFTRDQAQSVDRVAAEVGAAAVLVPNPVADVERVLVPLGGEGDLDRVASFVAAVVADRAIDVTLFHVAGSEDDDAGQALLDDAADRLRDAGLAPDRVDQERVVSSTPVVATATAAEDHDAVVMAEQSATLGSLLLGEDADRVAARSLGPVLVVQQPDGGDTGDA